MDPASAAVAFVGFGASIGTLLGLVIDGSRTLYEMQARIKEAPEEFSRICDAVKSLECTLNEILCRSRELDELDVTADIRQSWAITTNHLEVALRSLRGWLNQNFGSSESHAIGQKQFRQRLKLLFADKKIERFYTSVDRSVAQIVLLQVLINR